jgi:hypothetical protein
MTATCETCRYFGGQTTEVSQIILRSGHKRCRRYPAERSKHHSDWCGEHSPATVKDSQ